MKQAIIGFVFILISSCMNQPTLDNEFIDPETLVAPEGLTYAVDSATYVTNSAITDNQPSTSVGKISTYSITPSLPAGLTLDTGSGTISGTPIAASVATNYTVTGSNEAGQTSVVISITILQNPALQTNVTSLGYGTMYAGQVTELTVQISNPSSAQTNLDWQASETSPNVCFGTGCSTTTNNNASGTIAPNNNENLTIRVDTSGLAAATYNQSVTISSGSAGVSGSPITINLAFNVVDQRFVAVGASGQVWTSGDGNNWVQQTSALSTALYTVIYYNGRFIAGGGGFNDTKAMYSSDATATSWSAKSPANSEGIQAMAHNGTRFVAVGNNSKFWYADNYPTGNWTEGTQTSASWRSIAYGASQGRFMMSSGSNYTTRSSTTGASWPTSWNSNSTANRRYAIAYGNSTFVAVGKGDGSLGTAYRSTSGTSWVSNSGYNLTGTESLFAVAFGNGYFYTVGVNGKGGYSSNNGASFTTRNPGGVTLNGIAFGNGRWVTVGNSGNIKVLNSSDPSAGTWQDATGTKPSVNMYAIAFGP